MLTRWACVADERVGWSLLRAVEPPTRLVSEDEWLKEQLVMHWWFILRLQAMKGWRSPPTFLQRAVNTKPSLTEFEPPGSWHGHLFFSQPLIYPIPFVSNTYIELTIQNTSPKIYLHKLQKRKKRVYSRLYFENVCLQLLSISQRCWWWWRENGFERACPPTIIGWNP